MHQAVYDLHYLGMVHRDIKPENVGLYKDKMLVLYAEFSLHDLFVN